MAFKARLQKTDTQILDALLSKETRPRLSDADEKAFESMRNRLLDGKQVNLSSKQREWAERRFFDLDLDADEVTNDVSSGRVQAPSAPINDAMFGPMVLKPPTRK